MTAPALSGGRARRTIRVAVVDAASITLLVIAAVALAYIAGWYTSNRHHPAPAVEQPVAARQIVDQAAHACLGNHAYVAGTVQESRRMFAQCLDDYEAMVAGTDAAGPLYIPQTVADAINGHGCQQAWLEVDPGTGDAQWYCR